MTWGKAASRAARGLGTSALQMDDMASCTRGLGSYWYLPCRQCAQYRHVCAVQAV